MAKIRRIDEATVHKTRIMADMGDGQVVGLRAGEQGLPLRGVVDQIAQMMMAQLESIAGGEDFVFVLDLILPIGFNAARQIDLVALAQVEQGARRNRQHQFVIDVLGHAFPPHPLHKNRPKRYVGR